jgi:hypothetical protein
MRMIGGLTLLALVVSLSAGFLAAQDSPPASTTPPALVPVLKAIREANTMAEAASAYSGVAEGDRRNAELNIAYLRRLLQLGQPQAAGTPAATLASIPVNDGMAYGVIGYNAGRQNDLPKALTNTMKAAGLIKDDPSVQNNLGQLAAWNENDRTFKLSTSDQQTLDRLKTDMATQKAYMDAYNAIKDGYTKFNEANSANQAQIATATADLTAAQKKVADDNAAIKTLKDEEANDVKALQKLPAPRSPSPRPTRAGTPPPPAGPSPQAQALQQKIDDINKTKLPAANKTLQDDTAAQNLKAQALAKAKSTPVPAVPLAKLFYWLPPAVDGVVTMPPGTTSRPAGAITAPSAAGA